MPNWMEILAEIQQSTASYPNALDTIRRKYLKDLSDKTGRNVIAYYSGYLHGRNMYDAQVNDKDKNGFMLNFHKMDRSKGLDLVLHTPGGDLAATESLVDYLHSMFGSDIRAIIPQISMSAGTMIALSCKEIMMGKHSNLGPIDPQMGGVGAKNVLDEFNQAKSEVAANPAIAPLWQVLISKYHPTFLLSCQHAIDWSERLVKEWLKRNMCGGDDKLAEDITREFSDHSTQKSHNRHISIDDCKRVGVKIVDMESDQDLQEKILTVHHCYMHAFSETSASKIIENNLGATFVENDRNA